MDKVTNNLSAADIVCEDQTIRCQGRWKTQTLAKLTAKYQKMTFPRESEITIDTAHVDEFDTAGLWMLSKLVRYLKQLNCVAHVSGLSEEQTEIFNKITDNKLEAEPIEKMSPFLERLGKNVASLNQLIILFLTFFGAISLYCYNWFKDIQHVRWRSVLNNIDTTGLQASGIVALLSFLIGLVLAYQVGIQLQNYGATIYVVDLLGISLLREFSPLLTAIIVAGRSGSAFAAQIGTMKLNEELDALKTLGISPIEILVLPKVLGLIIALPLLTILAVCFSLFGGIIMSKLMLGISPVDFLHRFGDVMRIKTLLLGEIKTPIFAAMISSIGCFQGFLVTNSAASVGERTTTSVVHSIFMIIVCDALFSIIYSTLGI